MFWDKKEKGAGLPDLPPLPQSNSQNSPADMPSFPDSPENRGFPSFPEHSSDIKEAVRPEEIPNTNPDAAFKTREMPGPPMAPPESMENDSMAHPDSFPESEDRMSPPPAMARPEPSQKIRNDIFVKIDKFNSARKALSSAQDQMKEIESLLKKIREVRMREDQELSAWEKDLSETKSRIEEVSKNLFDKIE